MTYAFSKQMVFGVVAIATVATVSPALAGSPVAEFAKCAVTKDRAAARDLINRLPPEHAPAQVDSTVLGGATVCGALPGAASALAVRGALIEAFYKRDFVEFGVQPKRNASEFLRFDMPVADAPGDKLSLAMCVARSTPQLTDRLFATAPGSAPEESVMSLIMPYFAACQAKGTKIALAKGDLRGLIAHGAYMVSVRYWSGDMRAVGL